jgi:class 3 adenylate cyclase/pimeloyl-ACP methyl ester carboxylesterase
VRPETLYARNGDVHLAYQLYGNGPVDVMIVPGFVSHLEDLWELPAWAAETERFANVARIIRYDKRGTGLSDRDALFGTLEERVDDVLAVLDAAQVERAVLVGISEGGPAAALFAATHADRVSALVLAGTWANLIRSPTNPHGIRLDALEAFVQHLVDTWGTGEAIGSFFTEETAPPAEFRARFERHAASPSALRRIFDMITDTDVSGVLSAIHTPTLVVHSRTDRAVPFALGQDLAAGIPNATFEEVHGSHGELSVGRELFQRVAMIVGASETTDDIDRVLLTVLFTDIVDSTRHASELGDDAWRHLLDEHDALVHACVAESRGMVVKHTGDGVLAAFDGPARAVRCAQRIIDRAPRLGIEVRAGLHTGECERRGEDLGGIAVHVGARVNALAAPSEVLVTRTITDLVAGAGLTFSERGTFELKGLPSRWQLYALS